MKVKILNLIQEAIFCKESFNVLKDYLFDNGYTKELTSQKDSFVEVLYFAKIITNNSTLKEFLGEFFPEASWSYAFQYFTFKDIKIGKNYLYSMRAGGDYYYSNTLGEIIISFLFCLQQETIKSCLGI